MTRETWRASIQARVHSVQERLMPGATPEPFWCWWLFLKTGSLLPHRHQLSGRWTSGHSAGGSRNSSSYGSNPKFWLKVCDGGEVAVSLFQHRKWRNEEGRSQTHPESPKHQRYQAIALHMWQVWVCREQTCSLRSFALFNSHVFFLSTGGEKAL